MGATNDRLTHPVVPDPYVPREAGGCTAEPNSCTNTARNAADSSIRDIGDKCHGERAG